MTPVTLMYDQDHQKRYEQVKLNEYYHHAKLHIYHIYCIWENRSIKASAMPENQPASSTLIIT